MKRKDMIDQLGNHIAKFICPSACPWEAAEVALSFVEEKGMLSPESQFEGKTVGFITDCYYDNEWEKDDD